MRNTFVATIVVLTPIMALNSAPTMGSEKPDSHFFSDIMARINMTFCCLMEENRIRVGRLSTRPALIDPLLQRSLWDPQGVRTH